MDNNGDGQEVDLKRLPKCEALKLKHFTEEMFLLLCVLSGCDYLESIKGIGFKKAHRLVYENCSDNCDIANVFRAVRRQGKFLITADYEQNFLKAVLTFKF
jgi:exonuclease-1